ncbi:DUF3015 family protein [Pseudoalteromonas xiamenensis]
MKSKMFTGLALLAVMSVNVHAEDKKVGTGPNPFSDCGIGAALFQNNKVLAVTSNIIWDIGTTAVTSATASPETCNGKTVTAAKFILESYDNLSEEAARGEGEHLVALLNIMEVNSTRHMEVISGIRSEMSLNLASTEFNSADKKAKSIAFYNALVAAI